MTTTLPAMPAVALHPRLVVVRQDPFNGEVPLAGLRSPITPTALFYVRSHFAVPQIDAGGWRLRVDGDVARPRELTYGELCALPSRTLRVTLECAGNGRAGLYPPVAGEPWGHGAVSTAEWTGPSLATVLESAGPRGGAREILIEGADRGTVANRAGPLPFARGLPLARALHPDTTLAHAMNGEPLPPHHGFPVRLIVPGWYGMASVKWVARIAALAVPFHGYYQSERYVMPSGGRSVPLTTIRVRSLLIAPRPGAVLARGRHRLHGVAWSGSAPVTRVEVSVDGGTSWEAAALAGTAGCYTWRHWEYAWQARVPGTATLRSRAFDAAGNAQPDEPEWNSLGYANNAVQAVGVWVAGAP
jgi:DMSO/TMAO reductase YedYZ molybdopterin-dependent catalytic subunit